MCIFLLALIGILLFYASGSMEHFQLSERLDSVVIDLASGWGLLYELWPILLAAFFSGMLVMSLIMRLLPRAD